MSDSRQVSDSQVDDSLLNQSSSCNDSADFRPDTSRHFEAWLENLKPKLDPNRSPVQPVPLAVNNPPAPGELRFEGTLRIDCYVAGLLRSLTGTLIVSETAELESDVVVATAIIDGLLRGNIQAAERVELRRHAMVIGNIESPSLAIQPGAIFEGQCHSLPSSFELAALNSVDEDNQQAHSLDGSLSQSPGFVPGPGIKDAVVAEEQFANAIAAR